MPADIINLAEQRANRALGSAGPAEVPQPAALADHDPFGLVAACRAMAESFETLRRETAILTEEARLLANDAGRVAANTDQIASATGELRAIARPRG